MSYQDRVFNWAERCLKPKTINSSPERALRFLEEAIELFQACGMSEDDVDKIKRRVYSKPPEPYIYKEVGGVMVTLAVLCTVRGIDLDQAAEQGLQYCEANIQKIQQKHAQKLIDGDSVA